MSKSCIKKICAVVCALSMAAQLAVAPVHAAYINKDQSNYLGDFAELEPVKLVTDEIGLEKTTSYGLDMGGNFTVSMDAVFSGSFPAGSTDKGVANSTYFYMGGSGSGKVGSHLMVDAVNETGFKMHVKSDRVNATTSSYLSYDKKYNIRFKFSNVASGGNPAYASVVVEIYDYDEEGNISEKPIESLAGGLRNFSDGNGGSNNMPAIDVKVFTTEGATSSVELSNVQRYLEIANEIDVKVDGKTLNAAETTEIALPITSTAVLPIESTVKAGGSATAYTAVNSIAMADGSLVPEYIKLENGNIVADVLLPGGDNEGEVKKYDLIVKSSVSGYPDAKVELPVTLTKEYCKSQQIVTNYTPSVKDDKGVVIAENSNIFEDITLDPGNARVAIEWESSDENVIDSATGIVMPAAEDKAVTLTATITSPEIDKTYFQEELDKMSADEKAAAQKEIDEGTAVLGKKLSYTYNVKGTKAVVDAAVAAMKFESNDNAATVVDMDSPLNCDVVLPSVYTEDSRVEFAWESSNSNLTIKKNLATILQDDPDSVSKATLTGTVSYVKNGEILYETVIEYPIEIDVTQEGTNDKYIVRCDAAASENFADVPEDGDTVSSSIDLPTEGIFGSDISWSSSVPKAISNTGKVSKQSSAKKVMLTAVISKGAAPSEIFTVKNLVVPSTSGSTGGSGGGGGSSSSRPSTNSTVSSTGNRNSNVSYKGTLTPSTSLEKGDITTAQVSSFSDLSAAAWAKEAVTALYNKGIINGKSASTFAPNDDITRAEFAKIVVKAFGLEDTAANVSDFSDVKAGDWYYTAVASAYNKGIIKGYADGRFGVSDKITRQDMAVIIYRAAQAAGKTIAPVKDGVAFDDNAEIASYASEAVSVLQKGGVINGMTATTFAPSATATRAQAAQMIYGIVK